MSYHIKQDKNYVVKGSLLEIIQALVRMYREYPLMELQEDDKFKIIPMPTEKRDFLIGMLTNEMKYIDKEQFND